MNAKDQRKLCLQGFTIIRRHDSLEPYITFKSEVNPDSWKKHGSYPSKIARDREMARLLENKKVIED